MSTRITITPVEGSSRICLAEIKFFWGGQVEYLPARKKIQLFASPNIRFSPSTSEVRALIDLFPTVFQDVNFYMEEGMEKVSLNLNPGYLVSFNS